VFPSLPPPLTVVPTLLNPGELPEVIVGRALRFNEGLLMRQSDGSDVFIRLTAPVPNAVAEGTPTPPSPFLLAPTSTPGALLAGRMMEASSSPNAGPSRPQLPPPTSAHDPATTLPPRPPYVGVPLRERLQQPNLSLQSRLSNATVSARSSPRELEDGEIDRDVAPFMAIPSPPGGLWRLEDAIPSAQPAWFTAPVQAPVSLTETHGDILRVASNRVRFPRVPNLFWDDMRSLSPGPQWANFVEVERARAENRPPLRSTLQRYYRTYVMFGRSMAEEENSDWTANFGRWNAILVSRTAGDYESLADGIEFLGGPTHSDRRTL
jgi:hypothetical protein